MIRWYGLNRELAELFSLNLHGSWHWSLFPKQADISLIILTLRFRHAPQANMLHWFGKLKHISRHVPRKMPLSGPAAMPAAYRALASHSTRAAYPSWISFLNNMILILILELWVLNIIIDRVESLIYIISPLIIAFHLSTSEQYQTYVQQTFILIIYMFIDIYIGRGSLVPLASLYTGWACYWQSRTYNRNARHLIFISITTYAHNGQQQIIAKGHAFHY